MSVDTPVKAIPTTYEGITFRSRTEARWAVFFDALGVRWDYEPEGYQLPSGWYLPDFWLPDFQVWWEVKGMEPSSREHARATELMASTQALVFLSVGQPVLCANDGTSNIFVKGVAEATHGIWTGYEDTDIVFPTPIIPAKAGRPAWQWSTFLTSVALAFLKSQGKPVGTPTCCLIDVPCLRAAYAAARSYRFWDPDEPIPVIGRTRTTPEPEILTIPARIGPSREAQSRRSYLDIAQNWLSVNDRCRTSHFGEGTVIAIVPRTHDREIVVDFDTYGVKRFLESISGLEKIG